MSENVGASTSRNLKGLHGLYRDNFTFTLPWDLHQGTEETYKKIARIACFLNEI
jgi:hypothetical protein